MEARINTDSSPSPGDEDQDKNNHTTASHQTQSGPSNLVYKI